MNDTSYIYIDWGTTNCRIYTLNNDYKLLEEFNHPSAGILSIKTKSNYIDFYNKNILPHRQDENIRVYMSGMVGSAPYGWELAQQLTTPISVQTLAHNIHKVENFNNVFIIPGIKEANNNETFDLIRGEEIQAFGVQEMIKNENTTICLPGTHSKWLFFKDNKIQHFKTMMTGETFNIFREHSLLGTLIDTSKSMNLNEKYFKKGLNEAKNNDNLLNSLFKARAIFIDKENIESDHVQSYLSGILIGYEIFKAISSIDSTNNNEIIIVSSQTLATPYKIALDYHGIRNKWVDAKDASINGLKLISQSIIQT